MIVMSCEPKEDSADVCNEQYKRHHSAKSFGILGFDDDIVLKVVTYQRTKDEAYKEKIGMASPNRPLAE